MSTLMTQRLRTWPLSQKAGASISRIRHWAEVKTEEFKGDHRGDVAVIFALMAIVMMIMIGGAVDFGRWLHARRQTISAMDAAVLAGGRALQLNSKDVNGAIASAQKFYLENVKTRIATKNDTVAFAPANNNLAFTASGNVYIDTPLLAMANIKQLPLLNSSRSDYSKAELAVGGNSEYNLEISLMLDTSGSMSGSKIQDLKDAAQDLVDIVVWDDQSQYTSKVALAPFSADLRVPADMLDSVRGTGLPATKTVSCGYNCTRTYKLTPCVAERPGANRYTDAAPGAGNYVLPVYQTNASCSQPAADVTTPLTNNKTKLHAALAGMPVGGGTAGHLGTAWAWYHLSPNWGSVFPAGSQPAAYGTDKLMKIAILMTDGEFNTEYDSQGISTGSWGAGSAVNNTSVNQAKALCDGMKAKGITVYTVGFDLGGNQTAINTLNYCATDAGHFYDAANGDQLKQAFRDIALKISALYISN